MFADWMRIPDPWSPDNQSLLYCYYYCCGSFNGAISVLKYQKYIASDGMMNKLQIRTDMEESSWHLINIIS